jgi:outer membrane lipoprotein-sorting protein
MSKALLLLTATALIVLPASRARAQTADEVVEKYLTAIGGRAALGKVTSRTTTGTISVTTPAGDLTGTIELYNKAPNKVRTVVKIDASSLGVGQILQDQRFDGTAGYTIDSLNGNRDLTGDQLEAMRSSTFPTPLLQYKQDGARAELLGKEKVGDKDAYVLRFTPKTGPVSRQFMDAETYLLVKSVATVNVPQLGTIEQTVELSDYRDVDGVKVPYHMRSVNQVQAVTITFEKVEHNKAIDDGSFAKPAQ